MPGTLTAYRVCAAACRFSLSCFGGGEGALRDSCVGHHAAVLHKDQQSRPDVAVLGLGQPCVR